MPVLRSLLARAINATDAPFNKILDDVDNTTVGRRVTPESSLRVATVYAAVRLIAESVSSLPASLILRQAGRRTVQEGPLADLLTVQPNPEQDAPELWRAVIGWMLLEGNAYVYVERDRNGVPVSLWPIPATNVEVGRTSSKRPYYDIKLVPLYDEVPLPVPTQARVGPESVLHYRAFGVGTYGLSPIRQVREAVGTSLAAQEYMARFYKNDASPGGVVQVPGNLTDVQYDRLEKAWKAGHQGVSRAHLMAILEGGATWEKTGLDPGDAAFIETQKWESTEIARVFGVPPHMIGDVERSTSWGTGIAEQGIGFVTYTLTPWITRLEWVARRGLLRELDPRLRLKWRVEGLQRGDAKARYDAYAVGRQWGWLSTNDVRTLEDMDPVQGGDVYLQPLNMVTAGEEVAAEPERSAIPAVRSPKSRRRIAETFAPLIADADGRIANLERAKVDKLVRLHLDEGGSPATFMAEVEKLYGSEISDRTAERFGPIFATFAAQIAAEAADEAGSEPPDLDRWVAAYVASHVAMRTGRSVTKLRTASAGEDGASAVRARLDNWVADRPGKTARWESTQLSRAVARETWKAAGVREIRWVARGGEDCPFCQGLDGKVIGVQQAFVQEGDVLPGGEGQNDLTAAKSMSHPPIHPGCDCDISIA